MNTLFATSRFLKLGFGLAIILILNLFFIFSTQLVYKEPQYDTFCGNPQVRIIPQTKDECLEVGGQWTDDQFIQKGIPRSAIDGPTIEVAREGYCDADFTCRQTYDDARKLYERNFFIILVVLGTLTLIVSFVVRTIEVIAPSLAFGGVLSLFIASVRYWSEMQDYLRVVILGLALVALIGLGVRWFNRKEGESFIPPQTSENAKNKDVIVAQAYNDTAIIGLILSVVAIFGVGLAGIAGFILGIVALVQIKYTHQKGKGIAIAAIAVGFIWSFGVDFLKRLIEAGF